MGYWNHRAVKKIDYFGEPYYEIHEVYYNDDHTIYAMTVNPISLYGESLEDLKVTLERMMRCIENPILDERTIVFVNYEDGDPGEEDYL